MVHNELVERAVRWLIARCPVVITEMTSGAGETPDAIGFDGHRSILVECKTSMADFRADANKPTRRRERPLAEPPWPNDAASNRWRHSTLGDKRYYLVGEELADRVLATLASDNSDWGLLVAPENKRRRLVARRDPSDRFMDSTHHSEMALLVSALRRVGGAMRHPEWAVYVKMYVIKKQGEPRATMTIRPELSAGDALAGKESQP